MTDAPKIREPARAARTPSRHDPESSPGSRHGPHAIAGPATVHIWEGSLLASAPARRAARSLLSNREKDRADRFVHQRHRRRYTVAQACLRRVVGRFLDIRPEAVRFRFGAFGKPFVPGGPAFNQSHSGERIMIAVARGGRLGIDVEEIRPVPLMLRIARRRLAPDEARALLAAGGEERTARFFRIWTRKEAFLKALGVGLTHPLRNFSVDIAPDTTRALIDAGDLREDPDRWFLGSVPSAAGTAAALALDRPGVRLRPLDFDPAQR